jgi:hypothetical protein
MQCLASQVIIDQVRRQGAASHACIKNLSRSLGEELSQIGLHGELPTGEELFGKMTNRRINDRTSSQERSDGSSNNSVRGQLPWANAAEIITTGYTMSFSK